MILPAFGVISDLISVLIVTNEFSDIASSPIPQLRLPYLILGLGPSHVQHSRYGKSDDNHHLQR